MSGRVLTASAILDAPAVVVEDLGASAAGRAGVLATVGAWALPGKVGAVFSTPLSLRVLQAVA